QLVAQADGATSRGDLADAMAALRRALVLLPEGSKQYFKLAEGIRSLRERMEREGAQPTTPASQLANQAEAPQKRGWARAKAIGTSVLAFVLFKLKSIGLLLAAGWKPLLLGLTKLGTLSSMLLSLGVYWTVFGWRFALGLVLCIYVHEIGHVV